MLQDSTCVVVRLRPGGTKHQLQSNDIGAFAPRHDHNGRLKASEPKPSSRPRQRQSPVCGEKETDSRSTLATLEQGEALLTFSLPPLVRSRGHILAIKTAILGYTLGSVLAQLPLLCDMLQASEAVVLSGSR